MSDTNTPLWKQLLGAMAGATTAFVLYQGVMFTSDHLEAIVALPSAWGVTHQDQVRTSTPDDEAGTERRNARQQQVAAQFGISSVSGTVQDVKTGPSPVRPSGTIGSPAVAASSSVSSIVTAAASSDSSRVQYGPFGWMKGAKKFFAAASSSSVEQFAAAPDVALHAAASSSSISTGYGPASVASSSASSAFSWPVWPGTMSSSAAAAMPMWSSSSAAAMPMWASSSSAVKASSSSIVAPFAAVSSAATSSSSRSRRSRAADAAPTVIQPSAPIITSVAAKSGNLPQSGVGLGVIAFTALGAAVGRRRAKKA